MVQIGVVGHRYFSDNRVEEFVSEKCFCLLKQYKSLYSNLTTISAIAQGADTIFAAAAIELGLPLRIVRPFLDYDDDFPSVGAKRDYYNLREAACSEKILSFTNRSDEAYEAAMKWVVNRSDVLLAVWDGQPSRGRGGTGQAVQQAIQFNMPWIHLDTTNQNIFYHL